MRYRGLLTTCFFFISASLFGAPLPKEPAKGMPQAVWQFKSIDALIEDYENIRLKLKAVANEDQWPPASEITATLTRFWAGWDSAIDKSKPFGGYLTVESEVANSRPVFVLPMKDKKAALWIYQVLFGISEVPQKDYYEGKFQFIGEIPLFLRFHNDYAYITFENPSAIADAKKLPLPNELMLRDETALISLRLYIEGIPEPVKEKARAILGDFDEKARVGFTEMLFMGFMGTFDLKELSQRLRLIVDEGKWASLRLEFDRKKDEVAFEFNLTPKKESKLGKEIAAFKPRRSHLAGLLDDQTALGLLFGYGDFSSLKLPLDKADGLLKELLGEIGLQGDDEARGNLTKAILNSLRVNEADIAAAVKKSPKLDTYTFVLGAKLNQPKLLALALMGYVQKLPKERQKAFTINAAKIDNAIDVHKFSWDAKEDIKKTFGESDVYFCVKDELVFAAFGTGALDRLKECVKLQPKEGPQFLLQGDPSKCIAAIRMHQPEAVSKKWAEQFSKPGNVRVIEGTFAGGTELRLRYASDIIPVAKWLWILR